MKSGESTIVKLNESSTKLPRLFIRDPQIVHELKKLLTNQALLRIGQPTIFPSKYSSSLPIILGMLPSIYLLPAEMTLGDLVKEINICGYVLQSQTRDALSIKLHGREEQQKIASTNSLNKLFKKASTTKPVIDL